MAKWEEAFDHQVDLFTFWSSPLGQDFAHGYINSVKTANVSDMRAVQSIYGNLAARARAALLGADPIWVEPDMMTLVEAAAKSFVPEPLHDTDLITQRGFVWLPRPLWMSDIHGALVSYRALSWFPVTYEYRAEGDEDVPLPTPQTGIFLLLYHYAGDPDDYTALPRHREAEKSVTLHSGGLVLTHVTPWVFGEGYPDSESDAHRRYMAEIGAPGRVGQFDAEAHLNDGCDCADSTCSNPPRDPDGHFEVAGLGAIARWVQVLFRLMSQTITVRTPARPSRQTRKRWVRGGLPERHCVVVTLRRAREGSYQEQGEGDPVEWSHRWVVSGHWRNQWFPSLSLHRQIWISPYIKGPDEAPLVIRPLRAFKFAR